MNLELAWAWRPDVSKAFTALRQQLMRPDAELLAAAPAEVRAAVTYGRPPSA